MVTTAIELDDELLYPSGDGNPMAENTRQYGWIVKIKENLEILLRDRPDVFIAGDLLWYPEQVTAAPAPSQAPDVMVVFGRPKGDRKSYKQWQEDGIGPQVVFEILSASNKTRLGDEQMMYKQAFYERHGVEEYYIYDPDDLTLEGFLLQGKGFVPIASMSGWVSPRLGIRFVWQPRQELAIYSPTGDRFLSTLEFDQARIQAEQQTRQAEQRAQQAEQAQFQAVPRLLELGLSIEQIAEALGLSIAQVEAIAQS
jgi:Uma2 family endonuclease